MDNEQRNTAQDPSRHRNAVNQRRVLRNHLLPGLVTGEMGNIPIAHMENLVRMMQREYERLNPEQKRTVKRFMITSAAMLTATLGAINIYSNQKYQKGRTTANINSGLWSIAFLPLAVLIAKSLKGIINGTQQGSQRQDDETASLSTQSAPELDTLEGIEMGNRSALSNFAVLPEAISNSSRQLARNRAERAIATINRRMPVRSRSFP